MKKYAIFFPQFHQVKVNDLAWGYGFTDWTLIATANAFEYWNRRSPACGFYDLAKENVVKERFEEAADAGLDGFGIYHYRFEDGPELVAVERYLRNAVPPEKFGYFFIWANENWSKRWAGKDTELLKVVSKKPSREQVRDHVAYLKPFMDDEHYTKMGGRPMFVIYRPDFFEDPVATVACYREEFELVGINPAIGYFLKSTSEIEYSKLFDFCYLFEPRLFQNFSGLRKSRLAHLIVKKLIHSISYSKLEYLSGLIGKLLNRGAQSRPFSKFLEYFNSNQRKGLINSLRCPVQNVLTCGWNNAPRYRERFIEIVQVPSSDQFSSMVTKALGDSDCSENMPLLCNAWNEWSEGAAIEPCSYLGDSLLKAYLGKIY
jgi:hypothetical protein